MSCKRPTTFSYDPGSTEFVERRVPAPDTRQPGLEKFWGFQTADISSTTPTGCPSARTSASTWSSAATSPCGSITATATRSSVPEAVLPKVGAAGTVDLQKPTAEISKSAESPQGTVLLLDEPETIARKFKRAVTDTGTDVEFDPEKKPGVSNLLAILAATGRRPEDLAGGYSQYGPLKADAADHGDRAGPARTGALPGPRRRSRGRAGHTPARGREGGGGRRRHPHPGEGCGGIAVPQLTGTRILCR